MKPMKRANRIQRTQRQIGRALRVVAMWGVDNPRRWAKKNADHLARCSCSMCVRRKSMGDTVQQQRQALALRGEEWA